MPVALIVAGMLGVAADAGADAAAWVAKLGAARFADREEATRALEQAGRSALPALRAAREAKDPEVRARSAALLDKIESLLMVRPTLVQLDFRERPVTEVVRALGERSGIPVTLLPENSPMWRNRKVSLTTPEPVTFWTALEQLCREARLQHNVAAGASMGGSRGGSIQLMAGTGASAPYNWESGPFRATLTGIHHHRDVALMPGAQGATMVFPGGAPPAPRPVPGGAVPRGAPGVQAANPVSSEQFFIDLQVVAEPRMVVSPNGLARVTEAVDDRDQSILLSASTSPIQRPMTGFMSFNAGSVLMQMRLDLKYPGQPGKVIKRLKGSIPVIVAARKDEPLNVQLADSKGKTFRNGQINLVVHDVTPEPELHRTLIDLSVRSTTASNEPNGGIPTDVATVRMPSLAQNQIEVIDEKGRLYTQWFPAPARLDNEEARVTLILMQNENVGPPAVVRYYDLVRASTEVGFDFTDIPMP
jgi:hypothetical protein